MKKRKTILILFLIGFVLTAMAQPAFAGIPDDIWYEDRYITKTSVDKHYTYYSYNMQKWFELTSTVVIHERWKHSINGEQKLWAKWDTLSQSCSYVVRYYSAPYLDDTNTITISEDFGLSISGEPQKHIEKPDHIEPMGSMWQVSVSPQYGTIDVELVNGGNTRWVFLDSVYAPTFNYAWDPEITVYGGDILYSRIILDDLSPALTLENAFTY
jgi:hypothetical protein